MIVLYYPQFNDTLIMMKRFTTTLSAIAIACAALGATAQAEIKVASVNMTELNLMFYKRADAEATIRKHDAEIKQQIAERQQHVRKLAEDIQKTQKSLDPTLSDKEVTAVRSKLASMKNEYDAAAQEYQTFLQRRQVAFNEIVRRELSIVSQELHAAVEAVAAEGGYDLVVDSSAISQAPAGKVFPYVKPTLDISPAVLKRLNANAPADFDPQAELQRSRSAAPAVPAEAAE